MDGNLKMQAAGVAASAAGIDAREVISHWRNESIACRAIRKLFVCAVADEHGGIQEDFHKAEIAGISFVATKLALDGLVDGRIHSIEVSNLALHLHDPALVRYFGYDSTTRKFWREKPTHRHALGSPGVWPPLDEKIASAEVVIRELIEAGFSWFDPPLGTVHLRAEVPPYAKGTTFTTGLPDVWRREKRLVAHIANLLEEHLFQGRQYQIPAERCTATIGDLSFWLTPLYSSMAAHPVSYYIVVRHNKLSVHPKRAVAFHYWPGTRLDWVRVKVINA